MQNKTLNEYLNQLKELINKNDFKESIALLLDAIDQYPNEHKLKLNLGNVYKVQGNISNAKEIYNSLLETSHRINARNNLSLLLLEEGQIEQSIKYARKALEENSGYVDAKFNLSLGLFENKEYYESLKICDELLTDPLYKKKAFELKIRINQIICSWGSHKETHETLKNNQIIVHPFLHVSHVMDEESNYVNAIKWNNNLESVQKNKFIINNSKSIKLGFLCGEIRNHPTYFLIKNLFKSIKSKNIKMYMFSYNHSNEERDYIENSFKEFIDITNLNFLDARNNIKSYEIDILIDLTTIISHNRINILDNSTAKVIISYLAFPGTTGNHLYDYILTDTIVTPQKMQNYYSEKFLYLPGGYQVNNGELNIEIETKRESYNLPNDGVILGCLNQSFKLDPLFFTIWIDILSQHNNTYLWLLDEGPEMRDNIFKFIDNKVDHNRIIFAEKVGYAEHLKRIQHIDIAVDTKIYNGHTTSIEMLQAGVPLVTLKGSHFASRVSASILNILGINQLVTNSHAEYKSKIISLINMDYRNAIKSEIIEKLKNSKLLDNEDFADNFSKVIQNTFT